MVEHFGRQGGVSVDKQKAMPLGQGDASTASCLLCSGDVARGLVRDELDHAKPIVDGEGTVAATVGADGHARQDAIHAARKEVEERLPMH